MTVRAATAFSPSGISSFFEICDRTPKGTLIASPERVGARGGGFVIDKGVLTEVAVEDSGKHIVQVYINSTLEPKAVTTRTVARTLTQRLHKPCRVVIHHKTAVPIGAGFGSSAAGALGTALALGKALNMNLTMFQAGRIAHAAEVQCRTGLGTVGPVALGGCVVTVEPGAPGHAAIDRILTRKEHRIVAGHYQPILTKEVLARAELRKKVNESGRKTLDQILADPSLENFMRASKEFAQKAGFATPVTRKLIDLAEKAGAIGATQNMIGEAVHALTTADNTRRIAEAFKTLLPSKNVLTAGIDTQGARLLK